MARTVLTVSEAEIIDAISFAVKTSNAPEEAQTAKEIQEKTGVSMHSVNLALRALARQHRLQAHRVPRTAIDGVVRSIAAYTILAKPTKK